MMTEPFDPYAEERFAILEEIKAIGDAILERYRPLIEEAIARNWHDRRAMLFRNMAAERDAATKTLLAKFAALPSPPIIVTAEEARAFVERFKEARG